MRSYREQIEVMLDALRAQLVAARQMFPADDYCARLYYCIRCQQLDGAVAPADELPDDYACPSCKRPQEPAGPLLDLNGVRVT